MGRIDEYYEIDPPIDPERETPVPYYTYAGYAFGLMQRMGDQPTRYTLFKYVVSDVDQDTGEVTREARYPVKRHGPYVRVPVFWRRKRVWTTLEAFERFVEVVVELEAEAGVSDLGPDALKLLKAHNAKLRREFKKRSPKKA